MYGLMSDQWSKIMTSGDSILKSEVHTPMPMSSVILMTSSAEMVLLKWRRAITATVE